MFVEYTAPNPYPVRGRNVFSRLPSPSFFSKRMARNVLPALSRPAPDLETVQSKRVELSNTYEVEIQGGRVLTHDGAVLDTVEVTPHTLRNIDLNEKSFIIKFKGQKGFFESTFDDYVKDAVSSNMVVIGFNYRGVGHSKKSPLVFQDLVTDGIAQVQRLLDIGVNSEKILLDSESLGAAIATMVAFHFHEKKTPVYLFNSRSFSSLSYAAVETKMPGLPSPFKYLLRRSIASIGWEADVAAAYKQIDIKYKAYMVVAKPSHKSTGDTVIPHHCSLHRAVRKDEKYECKLTGNENKLTGYKVLAEGQEDIGHKDKRENLILKQNPQQSGQDIFLFFAQKVCRNTLRETIIHHSNDPTELTALTTTIGTAF